MPNFIVYYDIYYVKEGAVSETRSFMVQAKDKEEAAEIMQKELPRLPKDDRYRVLKITESRL